MIDHSPPKDRQRYRNLVLAIHNRRAVDEKTVAERQWQRPTLAPAPQQACDVGLFSDDSKQQDLF